MARPARNAEGESWAAALAFWALLVAAGLLLAAVSLAPKARALAELKARYAENQLRLVELERQAIELEAIADALENDPAFAAELAKIEFSAARPGDERIAVPESLRLGATDPRDEQPEPADAPSRWAVPPALLDPLATSVTLRATLLLLAGTLVLAAFLLGNTERPETVKALAYRAATFSERVAHRYRKA